MEPGIPDSLLRGVARNCINDDKVPFDRVLSRMRSGLDSLSLDLSNLAFVHNQQLSDLSDENRWLLQKVNLGTVVPFRSSSMGWLIHTGSSDADGWNVAVESANPPLAPPRDSPAAVAARRPEMNSEAAPLHPTSIISQCVGNTSQLDVDCVPKPFAAAPMARRVTLSDYVPLAPSSVVDFVTEVEYEINAVCAHEASELSDETFEADHSPPIDTPTRKRHLQRKERKDTRKRPGSSMISQSANNASCQVGSPTAGGRSSSSENSNESCDGPMYFVVCEDFKIEHEVAWHGSVGRTPTGKSSAVAHVASTPSIKSYPDKSKPFRKNCSFRHPASVPRLLWEAIGVLVLAYDIIMMPLQVFSIPENVILAALSWTILWYWTLDIPLSFIVGVSTDDGIVDMSFSKSARRYIRSWFGADLVIVGVDWFAVAATLATGGGFTMSSEDNGSSNNLSIVRAGKVLRMMRLMRLLRVMKLSSSTFVLAIQDRFDSERLYVFANLLKNVAIILVVNHFTACLWYWVGSFSVEGYGCWVTHYGIDERTWIYAYLTSLHWSLAQFANGEVLIEPQNVPERLVSIWVLLMSIVIFSSFVAIVGSTISKLMHQSEQFRRDAFVLRLYLRQHGVTFDLKMRVNRYVGVITSYTNDRVNHKDVTLFNLLSRPLQGELLTELYEKHLVIHPFLERLSERSKTMMRSLCCTAVNEVLLCREDILFNTGQVVCTMYLVSEGHLDYAATMGVTVDVSSGEWFCEAALWTDRWVTCGRMEAKTECFLVALDADKFRDVVTGHHSSYVMFPKDYAAAFIESLNMNLKEDANESVHDCHAGIASSIIVQDVLERWNTHQEPNMASSPFAENASIVR